MSQLRICWAVLCGCFGHRTAVPFWVLERSMPHHGVKMPFFNVSVTFSLPKTWSASCLTSLLNSFSFLNLTTRLWVTATTLEVIARMSPFWILDYSRAFKMTSVKLSSDVIIFDFIASTLIFLVFCILRSNIVL